MKTAAEVRAAQQENFKEYWERCKERYSRDIQEQLAEIEDMIAEQININPIIHWIDYRNTVFEEVKIILINNGYSIESFKFENSSIFTRIGW